MKFVIVAALALVAVAAAAPQQQVLQPVAILRSDFDQQPDGPYQFNFEAENGIKREEQGELKTVNDEENKPRNVIIVRGSYTYLNEEGKPITVNYYADETGYHAEGDTIPKPNSRR